MDEKGGNVFGNAVFCLLIVGCVLFALYSFLFGGYLGSTKSSYGFNINLEDIETVKYDLPENRNMYLQLDENEKEIYKQIREVVASGGVTVTFSSIDYDVYIEALPQAYDAVYYDFPEFFWLNGGLECSAGKSKNGVGYDMELELDCYDYWRYTADKDGYIDDAITEAQKIASMANTFTDTYDKVKFVHDYLVVNAEYDDVCAEEINKTVQRASSQQSHTIYGCLVNKVCVCDGYAKTFQLIMIMLGIECEYVEGDAGGGHAWNYVVIEGEEYWMDVTWDENSLEDDTGELLAPYGVNYGYFCVKDGDLYATHTPEPTFKIPVCDSDEHNFFHYEKSYLETYDFVSVCTAAAEQSGSQIIHIKFASRAELEKAVEELINKKKFKAIPDIGKMNAQFYFSKEDSSSQILHFYLP
ncbi:MAG: hypothetical protein IJZ94_01595 [Clostridia bacterium]|nr:hypothetical protein [Clostridia bacterium]